MFLDDDIYELVNTDVDALAADLSNYSVSVLGPGRYPDNSVACHGTTSAEASRASSLA